MQAILPQGHLRGLSGSHDRAPRLVPPLRGRTLRQQGGAQQLHHVPLYKPRVSGRDDQHQGVLPTHHADACADTDAHAQAEPGTHSCPTYALPYTRAIASAHSSGNYDYNSGCCDDYDDDYDDASCCFDDDGGSDCAFRTG